MSRTLIEVHVVCRNERGVRRQDDGTFMSRGWVLNRHHMRQGVIFALHEAKNQPSYLQGTVIDVVELPATRTTTGRVQRRLDVHVRPTKEPLEWKGKGAGEKGLLWS